MSDPFEGAGKNPPTANEIQERFYRAQRSENEQLVAGKARGEAARIRSTRDEELADKARQCAGKLSEISDDPDQRRNIERDYAAYREEQSVLDYCIEKMRDNGERQTLRLEKDIRSADYIARTGLEIAEKIERDTGFHTDDVQRFQQHARDARDDGFDLRAKYRRLTGNHFETEEREERASYERSEESARATAPVAEAKREEPQDNFKGLTDEQRERFEAYSRSRQGAAARNAPNRPTQGRSGGGRES